MKRIIPLVLLLLFPALAFAAPAIKFVDDTHDFGKVVEGEKLEYTFEFSNTGTDDLQIERVSTSWGCTAVVASSSHLKPGEKGGITATVDTRNRAGSIVKTVEVVSNDPGRPKVVLTLKAEVKAKDNPVSPQQTPDRR